MLTLFHVFGLGRLVTLLVEVMSLAGPRVLHPQPDVVQSLVAKTKSGEHRIRVDGFLPATGHSSEGRTLGAVVVAHGVEGPWRMRFTHAWTARRMADDLGVAVFLVHYFDASEYDDLLLRQPDGTLDLERINRVVYESGDRDDWVDVLEQATRWAARQPRVDAGRVALVGYSLGGSTMLECADRLGRERGFAPRCTVANYSCRFATSTLHGTICPVQLHHGEQDPIIPIEYARRTARELCELGATAELHEYEGEHVLEGAAAELVRQRTYTFLRQHLRLAE